MVNKGTGSQGEIKDGEKACQKKGGLSFTVGGSRLRLGIDSDKRGVRSSRGHIRTVKGIVVHNLEELTQG